MAPDDRIVFVRAGALWQVARTGGSATQLTKLGRPDGKTLHVADGPAERQGDALRGLPAIDGASMR